MNNIQPPRRKILLAGLTGFCTALLGTLPRIAFANTHATDKGIVVRQNEGIRLLTGRRKVPITIKISKARHGIDSMSFCVEEQNPGRKMRIHKHMNNDEMIFINKGEGTLTLDDRSIQVRAGDVAFVPRGTWHGLDNTGSETLIMMFQYSPADLKNNYRKWHLERDAGQAKNGRRIRSH